MTESDYTKVNYRRGLSKKEVEESRKKHGTNALTPPPRTPLWLQFLEQFKDPTIILLSVAAVISILLGIFHTGEFIEGIGIIIAILLATGVAFYSEYKSGKEFDILNSVKKEMVKVRRSREFHTIPSDDLVVGDVVYLEMGDRVPADGRVVKTTGLFIDQAVLTGESLPVAKTVEEKESGSGFPSNVVYRDTLVSDGSGIIVITQVGDKTEVGKIASSLAEQEEEQTPLQERLEVLAKQIGYVGMTFAVLIFIALVFMNYQNGSLADWNNPGRRADVLNLIVQYFMVAVTIIVVAVPEGLPMMVTMSLAFNMRRMAKANCLVKKLVASETIGSVTVICSDKTGTLTQNKMKPVWFYVGDRIMEKDDLDEVKDDLEWRSIVANSAVNSTAHLEFKDDGIHPIGNATEGALLGLLHDLGIDYSEIREKTNVVRQLPFSSERKRMVTVIGEEGEYICLEKGAPSILIDECSHVMIKGESKPIEGYRESIDKALALAGKKAYRVLAFTRKHLKEACTVGSECCHEGHDHILTGLVGIFDPLRPNVYESVEACYKAGIDVKMVTGDDINTARSIARECRILKDDDDLAIEHKEFEKMSDEELDGVIDRLKVLARSRPLDKLRLVKALHKRRETVGVTGDGTNDAPALGQADVGISMGVSGTEVAKEASDIVLLDDNFKSIVSGIHWGRTIYTNIQRLIQFQLTVNVAALLTAFLGPFLGVNLPLTVIQLLWVNIIMDTFAALALSSEPPRDYMMKRKPLRRDRHIITPEMAGFIGLSGIFMTAVILILLKTGFLGGTANADGSLSVEQLTIIFTTFVMFQFWNEFNCRSLDHRQSPFEGLSKNRMFIIIVSIIFAFQVIVVNFGGKLFRTVPLPLETWGKIILLTAVILPVGYLAKWISHMLFGEKDKDVKAEGEE